jgi:type I restriction enzyme, S subunit
VTAPTYYPLSELATFTSGGTPSKRRNEYYLGDIPWITGADINSGGGYSHRFSITRQAVEQSAAPLVQSGSLLLVTRTSVGKVAVASDPVSFSQDITAIHPDTSRLDPSYLRCYLNSKRSFLESRARGATIRGIARDALAQLPVPLLDPSEQRRIVKLLDTTDKARRQREKALTATRSYSSALLSRILDADPPIEELGAVSLLITKGTTPTTLGHAYAKAGIPFLRVQNLSHGEVLLPPGSLFIDQPTHESLRRSWVYPGDVLLSIAGTIGRSALVADQAEIMNCNQAVAIVRLTDRLDGEFVQAWLDSEFAQREMRSAGVTGTIANLSLSRIRELKVPVPSASLQEGFRAARRKVKSLAKLHEAHLAKLDELHSSLQARAFKGQL